ncbi:hypothetical protein M9H77_11602 [Catharanthus roseus]|uniref:Uncharacterized protein n=1 Tax=Catharanthus roseus TaxID=4058 RepID=A0ACC0BF44_CATRO|nr:hypothetical protein M9H77_11602 [Catharanthus roseus]
MKTTCCCKALLRFCTCLLLLLLPARVECSSSRSQHIQEDSPKTFDVVIHGILLWASMAFLMPVGILIIRMASTRATTSSFKLFYYLHSTLQVVSVLLASAAAVISIRKFENSFNNCHQRVGLALYVAIYVQVLSGFRRPERGSKSRRVWYFFHWILGTSISLVGIFNTYTGLKAYHVKMSKSISIWTILFTGQVCFMAFLFLFQDKWDYIHKQGNEPISPSLDQIISQNTEDGVGSQNNKATEPRRKSNSLGAYFSRSNALNKLFQLTG